SVAVCAFAIDYWFIPPLFAVTTTWHEIASVVSFAMVGVVVAWLTATRRHVEDDRKALLARERAARASAEAANRAKDECVATLAGAGRTERHALAVHGEAVWVEADPVRVEQIVVNLLDNALKYTPPGGAVDVTIARESSHGLLRVRDTGVGIPREMLPRIFDLFVQGEPGAIRGRSGLGIGLAVVHR